MITRIANAMREAGAVYQELRSLPKLPGAFLYINPSYAKKVNNLTDIHRMATETGGYLHGARNYPPLLEDVVRNNGVLPPGPQVNVDPSQVNVLATGDSAAIVLFAPNEHVSTDAIGHAVLPAGTPKQVIAIAKKGTGPASPEYSVTKAVGVFLTHLFSINK